VMNSGGLIYCMYTEFQNDPLEKSTNIKDSNKFKRSVLVLLMREIQEICR
jgi:hypothetical protein